MKARKTRNETEVLVDKASKILWRLNACANYPEVRDLALLQDFLRRMLWAQAECIHVLTTQTDLLVSVVLTEDMRGK